MSDKIVYLRSGHEIGRNRPCFIVAEIGNNHQGQLPLALELVHAAAESGAQAVKFQKRDMDALFTKAGREAPYTGKNSFGPTYGEHRLALELTLDEMALCKEEAERLNIVFFASSWDMHSFREMQSLDVELHKICSADLVNVPLLRAVGATDLPVILSTGMSALTDVDLAVAELTSYHDKVILLHCNSSYPCPEEHVALPVMPRLGKRYGLPVGYSGHERGLGPSIAAAALGACVIERHFTLDKNLRGTDHQVSLTPEELATMNRMIREVELAMLQEEKVVCEQERSSAKKLRKSIVFSRDLPVGRVLTECDLALKCPGDGVSPREWDTVLGAMLLEPVRQDQPFAWKHVTKKEERQGAPLKLVQCGADKG